MVTPVLHVLPLTFRSPDLPIAVLLRAFRDSFERQSATMPVVDEVFLQSTVAKIFFACGALTGSILHRLRRA